MKKGVLEPYLTTTCLRVGLSSENEEEDWNSRIRHRSRRLRTRIGELESWKTMDMDGDVVVYEAQQHVTFSLPGAATTSADQLRCIHAILLTAKVSTCPLFHFIFFVYLSFNATVAIATH